MSIYSLFARRGPSGFGYASTAEQVTEGLDLRGKAVLVTGVSSGLGAEALRVLTLRGARVVGTARTEAGATGAARSAGSGQATGIACELGDPASVRACVAAVKALGIELHAIIANAGIMALPKREVRHGWELQLFTNHFGHFLLVTGLLDALAPDGRVVMLSSGAHFMAPKSGIELDDLAMERGYSPWTAYGQSKLANLLFAKELARRFAGSARVANAVHPGVIATNLTRHMNPVAQALWSVSSPLFLKSVPQGAATEVWAAVHPGAARITGQYLADCNVAPARADADDALLARRLWEASEALASRV